jgi:hypothetical protein
MCLVSDPGGLFPFLSPPTYQIRKKKELEFFSVWQSMSNPKTIRLFSRQSYTYLRASPCVALLSCVWPEAISSYGKGQVIYLITTWRGCSIVRLEHGRKLKRTYRLKATPFLCRYSIGIKHDAKDFRTKLEYCIALDI